MRVARTLLSSSRRKLPSTEAFFTLILACVVCVYVCVVCVCVCVCVCGACVMVNPFIGPPKAHGRDFFLECAASNNRLNYAIPSCLQNSFFPFAVINFMVYFSIFKIWPWLLCEPCILFFRWRTIQATILSMYCQENSIETDSFINCIVIS